MIQTTIYPIATPIAAAITAPVAAPFATLGNGSLSIMAKPDTANLTATFQSIKSSGATHLVSLLENTEANTLGLATEADWCRQFQMEFLHFPIADFSTPASIDAFSEFTKMLLTQIQQGAHTVIHCRGGIGRAGMTASTVLVHAGFTATDAIALVSKSRGVAVPETNEQTKLIQQLQIHIKK